MKKLILPVLLVLFFVSCKKDAVISSPDAQLMTSADSLKFDTVFTTVGSITQSFKIINPNDQRINLSSIKLMGGSSSAFNININGTAEPEVQNVEIGADDSIYIFVTVSVDPNAAQLPFIISDSIRIAFNGNEKFVQLEAFGQNAIFLRNAVIGTNQTWTNDLPYVILEGIKVLPGIELNVAAGTKIYSHINAAFLVEGTLQVHGSKTNPVLFTGDRLDEPYRDFPASWPGIIFTETSIDNQLIFAEIKNAYQAVVVLEPSANGNPKLMMQQSIIHNAYDAGLFCSNSYVTVNNSLISNSNQNLFIQLGGKYEFTNCSFASYSNNYLIHKTPVATVTNFVQIGADVFYTDLQATFNNSIFWSSENILTRELEILKEGNGNFDVVLNNCIYKAATDPDFAVINNCIANMDPLFDSIDVQNNIYDFRIRRQAAPGVDNGLSTIFATDLDNNNRTVGITDIGCYEKQ